MSFSHIKEQPRAVKTLKGFLSSGKIPSAMLFLGPDGIGKTLAARRPILELPDTPMVFLKPGEVACNLFPRHVPDIPGVAFAKVDLFVDPNARAFCWIKVFEEPVERLHRANVS